MSNDGTGYVGIDKNYFVGIKEVLNITAETGAWETQTRVKRLQPADVVEVVRCKNCKHKIVDENGEYNPENIVCFYWQFDGLTENDFCSQGKK